MTEDWCRQKLSALSIEDRRLETLNEIKLRLKDVEPVETSVTTKILTSSEIFDCLNNSATSDQTEAACEILAICLSSLELDLAKRNASSLLQRTLKHRNPKVRSLALNEILRFFRKNPTVENTEVDLTLLIIACLEYDEIDVGGAAVDILSSTLKNDFDDPAIRSSLLNLLVGGKDIICCRVYEIAVNIAKSSPALLSKVQEILNKAIKEMESDDVLLQLSILELLVSLAEQNHGLVYLENQKVFENINRRVQQIDQNPLDRFLIPGFMKFFGKIAYSQPQRIITGYPHMIQCLFESLLSGDVSILPTAFDTLGNLAQSNQGKNLLESYYPNQMKEIFEEYRNYLRNLPTDLKNRCFNGLEVVFKTKGEVPDTILEITKKWCSYLTASNNLDFLLEFCKNPFPDIKVSALSFIKTICEYSWGVVALKNTAGFIEYLLDRKSEFDKDARFAKYNIICILAESTVFDAQTLLQLKKYVDEGPYYVEGVVEIVVEGS